jgi:deoxyribodipyrimidine photo-lyase
MRPQVWRDYQTRVADLTEELGRNGGLRKGYTEAIEGRTGIEPFDAWARELTDRGYVHNHARMWFASIWIFTLGLPWELGADFFLRHLYDGDPASNTLSWRWVGGLHTAGKTYLARADNIETYTQGRFFVEAGQLARNATPLGFAGHPAPTPLAQADMLADGEIILLVTEEDCRPETLPLGQARVVAVAALDPEMAYDNHAAPVIAFKRGAVADAAARAVEHFKCPRQDIGGESIVTDLKALASQTKCASLATAYLPVGPLRDRLAAAVRDLAGQGITLRQVRRDWDSAFWPHATHGFFKLKEKIPAVLSRTVLRAA